MPACLTLACDAVRRLRVTSNLAVLDLDSLLILQLFCVIIVLNKNETAPNDCGRKAAEPKVKVPPPISDEDIRAAYESALTKFDSLDHWFSSGGNVKSVSQTLFEEIAEDLGCISEDAKDTSKKKKKKKPINEASGGGAAGQSEGNGGGCGAAEHCEFARGTVRSFRKCGCSECTKQLAKQQFIKTYVMRQVGSAFGGWKVRAAGGGGL